MIRDSEAAFAVASLKSKWARISNSSIVTSHVAFNTQIFGDASVIIVSDFFPDSITLRDRHFTSNLRTVGRGIQSQPSEQVLWSYVVQIANALKIIHSFGLAARYMDAKRWLVTDEDRIRFNACGLADIIDPSAESVQDLQREDIQNFAKLIIALGTTSAHNKIRPMDHFARIYSPKMRRAVDWLQQQTVSLEGTVTVEDFLQLIASESVDAFDASLRNDDMIQHALNRELENARLVRLQFKLNAIIDRPEYEGNPAWRDQGPRAAIKLFQDYVFHQIDANGNPVLDMGHMLGCLNKLDVGTEEKITLMTRNEQTVIVVTYREMKNAVESSWSELMRRSTG